MMKRQRVFRPLTLKSSPIADAAARQAIETLFDRFNVERPRSIEAARKAAIGDAESSIAMQQARKAFVQLLPEAGVYLDPIRGEQTWTAYRTTRQYAVTIVMHSERRYCAAFSDKEILKEPDDMDEPGESDDV